ncbi:TetR family transcriptional regulator [Antrihabitans sp. YC2-6]|uniref:TetR family transcriptional regulator n=1 Tax=Antrihabitans sp. YC2-6 TaxID=2799498 RepID=UPI0018F7C97D|nr:TetR family transcriptional regulator [Antrihabitans sp. YC2-6]MBJ8348137.1 TetR family transcriptional regulator [Antrihabitans sp. YC2-6]
MSESVSFQAEMRQLLRERALDAARELTVAEAWSAVNMSRVAADIGVSRPVLYKEFAGKHALAAALVERETDQFLDGIVGCLNANPDDLVGGLAAAAEYTLRTGADNTLIKVILAGEHGPDTGLLPLLATDPAPVLGRAVGALVGAVRTRYPDSSFGELTLESAIEAFVRITLSHLMQPLGPIENATAQIRQVVAGLFDSGQH